MQHFQLHILRQTGRKTLNVHFLGIQAAWLNKQLVAGLVGKADNFRLNAGAVAGADTGDGAVIHGAAVEILPDDAVGFLVGIGEIADGGVVHLVGGAEGERFYGLVPGLQFHFGKINASPVDPGRGAGFEPPQGKPQLAQPVGKADAGVHSVRAGGNNAFTGDNGAVQIGAGGDHHGTGGVAGAQLGDHALHMTVFYLNVHNLRLLEFQMLLLFQGALHIHLISLAICLGAQGMDGGTLAPVEHPILNAAGIGGHTHFAAQSVQLPHQMPLAGAANGGIAGHIAHGVQIDGKQNGVQSQPGGSQGSLDSGVTRADDGNVTASGNKAHWASSVSASGRFFSSGGSRKGLHTTSQRLMGVPRAWNFSSYPVMMPTMPFS